MYRIVKLKEKLHRCRIVAVKTQEQVDLIKLIYYFSSNLKYTVSGIKYRDR